MEKPSHLYSNKWHEHTPGFHTGTRLRHIIPLHTLPLQHFLLLITSCY